MPHLTGTVQSNPGARINSHWGPRSYFMSLLEIEMELPARSLAFEN
jgi:hypothetical protein